MAATESSFGMWHLTVVPTNFESSSDEPADSDSEATSVGSGSEPASASTDRQ